MRRGTIDRRRFLAGSLTTGLAPRHALGASTLTSTAARGGASPAQDASAATAANAAAPGTWPWVREQFRLDRTRVQMSLMLFASHPTAVREAIERHRRALDENPVLYLESNFKLDAVARESAAEYVGGKPEEIALTANTTTGLALLYGALPLKPGQEILTTTHDHYVTFECLRLRELRSGNKVNRVALYAAPEQATTAEIVNNLRKAIGPRTRILAVTWVHSSTGVKLPIRAMADVLAEINQKRPEPERVLFCVDGVHGFGAEAESVSALGCDFFVAGCHKWLFGPRGTGLVWGRKDAWQGTSAIIPCFEWAALEAWMHGQNPDAAVPGGLRVTPGGFQAYEHRWALPEAFRFHQQIGKARIAARIHELAQRCKTGLSAIRKVKVRTPLADEVSAGITCFEIEGLNPKDAVARLLDRKIVASNSPYLTSYVRLTPGILNTPEEVDRAVAEVKVVAA